MDMGLLNFDAGGIDQKLRYTQAKRNKWKVTSLLFPIGGFGRRGKPQARAGLSEDDAGRARFPPDSAPA